MKKQLIFAAVVLALAACSNDESLNPYDGPVEIRLSSGIEVQTRAMHSLDTQLGDGERVHVWVDDATTNAALYENNALEKGNGGTLSGGTTMYFPQTGNNVDIYALHGNVTLTGNTFPENTPLTHTVAADQRSSITTAGQGYQGSDLVYAKSTDVARNGVPTTTVELNFHHLLSKIEVVLIEGDGDGDFLDNISTLQVLGTKLNADFTLTKAGAAYGKNTENQDGIEVTASGDPTPISLDTGVSDASAEAANQVLNEAIIVPQEIAANTPFIKITLAQNGEQGSVFTYNLEKATTFESGKKYRYVITVRETELKVTSSIEPWINGSTTPGFAE